MCRFFSALVVRNGDLLHDPGTDSHTDLIDEYKLDLVENSECRHFAKIEFVPKSADTMDDIDSYTLTVDESTEPIWFDEVRDQVLAKCRSTVKQMIIQGEHKCILSGKYILGKDANVKRAVNSNIVAMLGSSRVGEMWGSSQVGTMRGSSQVGTMLESSQVGEMRGSSRVGTMRGSSQVVAMLESSQVGEMWGSSRVGEMWGSSQVGTMWGSSQVQNDNRTKQ